MQGIQLSTSALHIMDLALFQYRNLRLLVSYAICSMARAGSPPAHLWLFTSVFQQLSSAVVSESLNTWLGCPRVMARSAPVYTLFSINRLRAEVLSCIQLCGLEAPAFLHRAPAGWDEPFTTLLAEGIVRMLWVELAGSAC